MECCTPRPIISLRLRDDGMDNPLELFLFVLELEWRWADSADMDMVDIDDD